jgi:feruloyl esterase
MRTRLLTLAGRRILLSIVGACSVLVGGPALAQSINPAASCAALSNLLLPNATIETAQAYGAGDFKLPATVGGPGAAGLPPPTPAAAQPSAVVPAMCRVRLTLKPSSDSDIKMEVWLPMIGWNGKFVGVANFGTGGSILYRNMVAPLTSGYALAANDTGHSGDGAGFAVGHPEKMVDYSYRADHEMTIKAKQIVAKFYGKAPSRSIWIGCSLGGIEALIEAKRYPADYDGIVAGAPPNPLPLFNAQQIWGPWLNLNHPEAAIPGTKFAMIHKAALQACATPVGLAQGFIEDPEHCQFDPGVLQCKGDDGPDCLTTAQVKRLLQLYEGPVDPRTNKVIFPGPNVGAENEFVMSATRPPQPPVDLYRYMVFQDQDWDWKSSMNFTTAVDKASRALDPLLTVDSNLNAFLRRGGKLMLYVGWTEGHNGNDLVKYYKRVLNNAGSKSANNMRLFMVPGMNHCGGGFGCDTFEKIGVVDQWIQTGQAPDVLLSSKLTGGTVIRTRPLCAWPAVARYKGGGSMDDAASFECAKS